MSQNHQSRQTIKFKSFCRILSVFMCSPRWQRLVLQYAEVEQRRPEANSQVHRRHLVLLHQGSDIAQEVEQRLQDLPVLIGHQQNGRSDGLQPLLLWDIWTKKGKEEVRWGHSYRRCLMQWELQRWDDSLISDPKRLNLQQLFFFFF